MEKISHTFPAGSMGGLNRVLLHRQKPPPALDGINWYKEDCPHLILEIRCSRLSLRLKEIHLRFR